ncbi:MAG: rod shape-determining protein MreC [Actinomycetia bacterium]|nr:rod shape-determining protein MreC [Actinomycetes bacterium]
MIPSSGRRFDRPMILFIALVIIGFIVATFDVRSESEGVTNVLREGTQSVFTPFQKGVDWVVSPVIGFIDGISNIAGLRDENERLRAQVNEAEAQLREITALEEKVLQLELINGLEVADNLITVTARIYASGASAFDNVRYIDKGARDGIIAGQAVVDEDGLVGRVDLVSANDARIRLITDPLVSAGVRVRSSNETGIVSGRGDGPLRLEMFRPLSPVYEGDLVVTDGSRFPPGIVVGLIDTTTDAEVGFVLRADVSPAARLSQIDFVKVVVGWSPIDDAIESGEDPTTTTTTDGSTTTSQGSSTTTTDGSTTTTTDGSTTTTAGEGEG